MTKVMRRFRQILNHNAIKVKPRHEGFKILPQVWLITFRLHQYLDNAISCCPFDTHRARQKIKGKHIRLDIIDIDTSRRMVGIILLDDRNINLEKVRGCPAEAFIEYLKPRYRAQFLEAERESRKAKQGIWELQGYKRPREFRRRLKLHGGEEFDHVIKN